MQAKITKIEIEKLRKLKAANPGKLPTYIWDTEQPGLGYKLTPKLRGSFVFQYRMPGKAAPQWMQIDRRAAMHPDEARNRAKEYALDVSRGGDPAAERAQGKLRTVSALIDGFEASRKAKGRRSAIEMAKTLRRHVAPAWGEFAAVDIRRDHAKSLLTDIAASHPPLANKVRRLLHTMFAWALVEGWTRINPIAGIEPPGPEDVRQRALSNDELVEVWQASGKLIDAWRDSVRLLILTGQRRSEVGGMLRDELDLPNAIWTIDAARSKSKQPDITQLSPQALAILFARPVFKDCPYVLTNDGQHQVGGWSLLKEELDTQILAARKAAAVERGEDPETVQPMAPWRLHDLRRTCATNLAKLRVEPHVIDRILHHSRKSQGILGTYNVYEYFDERKAGLDKWGARVASMVSQANAQKAAE